MQDTTLRPSKEADWPTVNAIARLCWGVPLHRSVFELTSIVLAERNQATAGFIAIDFPEDVVLIYTVAVHPEFRRAGIATELVESAQAAAVLTGKPIGTLVEAHNSAGLLLLGRLGFICCGATGHQLHLMYGKGARHAA